ncbi:MAG: FAD-dependent oxidoreductase [Actinomycetota bacterium]|nr:FAD-dependent oxidoreductase [Actinomycetota bacterium]
MVAVDVAIVGGGIQGLVLLRELTSAGYTSVLVTNADLGSGQTLHSHGLLNSGTGLLSGALQHELFEVTLPYLRRLGVAVSGADRSFFLAPDALVEKLSPGWEANHYRPARTDPSSLPAGLEPLGLPVYRVPGVTVDKRRLVAALAAGLEPLVLRGQAVAADQALQVRSAASKETIALEARAVVVAAGCGTKHLLRRVFGVDEGVLERITYRKAHMICVRAPRGVLPDVAAVMSPELLIVAHPPLDATSENRLETWYVTPADPEPALFDDAPDDGAADVDAAVVATGTRAVRRLVPGLARDDRPVEATVFAGYKQDFDGQPIRRACEVVDGERNVIMALPSVLANAVPNAVDALTLIRQRLEPAAVAPEVQWGPAVAVGQVNEDTDQTGWEQWSDFARRYGEEIG